MEEKLIDFFESNDQSNILLGGISRTEHLQLIADGYFEASVFLLKEIERSKGEAYKKGDYWIYPIFSNVHCAIRLYLLEILNQLNIKTDKYSNIEIIKLFDNVKNKCQSQLTEKECSQILEVLSTIGEYIALMTRYGQSVSEIPQIKPVSDLYLNINSYQRWVEILQTSLDGILSLLTERNETGNYAYPEY